MRRIPPKPLVALVMLATLSNLNLQLSSAFAATRTWNGLGANNNWSNPMNWSSAVVAGDDLVFPGGAGVDATSLINTNDFAANTAFRSITFTGTNYVLNGNAIVFTNTGVTAITAQNGGGTNTVNLALRLDASQTFQSAVAGTLTVNGDIALNGQNLTNTALGGIPPGVIRLGGGISGTGNLAMSGDGRVVLQGSTANTFVGTTTVNAGELQLVKGGNNGAIPGSLIIGDGSGSDLVQHLAGDQIANSAVVTINSGAELDLGTFSDIVGGLVFNAGTVSSSGTGRVRLNGNVTVNASSVTASIAGGLELVNFDRTFTIADGPISPDLSITATISGAGGLIKTGAGELRLSSSNSYAGVTTVDAGFVSVSHGFALGSTNNGTIVNSNGVLSLLFGAQVGNEPLTLNSAGVTNIIPPFGALHSSFGLNSWEGPITLVSTGPVSVRTNDILELNGAISGAGGLTKFGPGTLILAGTNGNSYSGATTVKEGSLWLGKASANPAIPGPLIIGDDVGGISNDVVYLTLNEQIADSMPVVVNGSGLLNLNGHAETVGALTLAGARILTAGGTLTLGGNILVKGSTNSQSLVNGVLSLPATRMILFTNSFFAYDLVLPASISGAGGLTLSGAGGLILGGSNSFLGETLITELCGLLATNSFAFGNTNAGVTASGLSHLFLFGGTRVSNEALTLNSARTPGALLSGGGGTNSWSGPITLGTNTGVDVATWLLLSNSVSGAGGFTKIGASTLEFAGTSANTYVGTTTVNEGTLLLSKPIPNVSIPADLIVGDGLGGADSDVVQASGNAQINDLAAVTVHGSGLLRLPTFPESIGSLAGSGHVDSAGGNLEVGFNNTSTTFTGLITGSGGLTKQGTGTLTLEGNNPYTGATLATGGKLIINGSQPQSPVTVTGGGSLGGHGVVGNLFVSSGSVAPGASPGVLTCSNLTLNGSGFTPAGFNVELNGAAPGTGYDQLNVRGVVSFTLAQLNATLGFPSAISNSFTIVDNDGADAVTGIVGIFSGLPEGATVNVSGTPFRISYVGGSGNDVVLTQLTATQRPILKIQPGLGTNVLLSWGTNFTGYSLEANTNLNTSVWAVVTNAYAVSGANNFVTNATVGLEKYYRLRAP